MDSQWQSLGAWPTLLALGGAVLLGALGVLAVLWEALWPDPRTRRWQGLRAADGGAPQAGAGRVLAPPGVADRDGDRHAQAAWMRVLRRQWQRLQVPAWLQRRVKAWWPRITPGLYRALGALGLPDAQLKLHLQQAGWDRPQAALRYRLAAAAGLLGGPLLLWLLSAGTGSESPARGVWQGVWLWLLAAWAGLRLPDAVLSWRRHQRQRRIFNALPGALDLMRVCVQAGLGLDAAMDRVGRELRWSCPPLSLELALLGLQLRAGAARSAALRQMAARIGLTEFDSLVGVLVQSERFGTPVGQALQAQATLLRERRRQRAEAAAARLPVQLVLPLVLCVLPALLVVLLGPAVLGVLHNLLPGLAGR